MHSLRDPLPMRRKPKSTHKSDSAKASAAPPPSSASKRRTVLLHFHIFKNAGSTLNSALVKAFGPAFHEVESPDPNRPMDWKDAISFIEAQPGAGAISSHTLRYPPPVHKAFHFLPLLLIRHPIDRLVSIYHFERRNLEPSDAETSRVVQTGSLANFVRFVLAKRPELGCNTQLCLVARSGDYEANPTSDDLTAAKAIVDRLPVPGVVERTEQYLAMLEVALGQFMPGIDLACANENQNPQRATTLLARLRDARSKLPPALWRELRERNQYDLELWRHACRRVKAYFQQDPQATRLLNDLLRRKALANAAAARSIVSSRKTKLPRYGGNAESALNGAHAGDRGAYARLQEAYSERLIWAKSLEKELRLAQSEFKKLDLEFAERTEWAKKLDHLLQESRAAQIDLTELVEERTTWAKDLKTQLTSAIDATQHLEAVHAKAIAWAQSLDSDLARAKAAHAEQAKLLDERTAWAQSLDDELAKTRAANAKVAQRAKTIGVQTLIELRRDLALKNANLNHAHGSALDAQLRVTEAQSQVDRLTGTLATAQVHVDVLLRQTKQLNHDRQILHADNQAMKIQLLKREREIDLVQAMLSSTQERLAGYEGKPLCRLIVRLGSKKQIQQPA